MDFPTGLLDLSSFSLFFDVECADKEVRTTSSYTYILKRYPPRNSASFIERLRILINDKEISNVEDYNILYNMIVDVKDNEPVRDILQNKIADFDYYTSDNLEYLSTLNKQSNSIGGKAITDYVNANGYIRTTASVNAFKYVSHLSVTDWLHFFNEVKYLNTYDCKLSIEIKWADAHILFHPYATPTGTLVTQNPPEYYVTYVRGTIYSLDFELAKHYDTTEITFRDWFSRRGLPCQTDKTTTMMMNNIKTKSVNKILGTFVYNNQKIYEGPMLSRNYSTNTIASFVNPQTVTDVAEISGLFNSYYFRRIGHGCQRSNFFINENPINRNPMNIAEMYNAVLHMFNVKTTRASFLKDYIQDFFMAGISLEDSVQINDDEILVSGYDTRNNTVNIRWETQGAKPENPTFSTENWLGQPLLYVEFMKSVSSNGNSIKIE
eukprot:765645-Hanusia_phi.AAC.7